MSKRGFLLWFFAVAAVVAAPRAGAFGPDGHRIAGLLAGPRLCAGASAEVAALGGGESLAELGVWADAVRSMPEWRQSAPWHFMNVADAARAGDLAAARASIAAFRHPPEGDVLEAIERFRRDLANRDLPAARRLDALRFLVHFVVDVHQPLHVGRAEDRGGNTIDVRYGDTVVNLHRFWDTDVIDLAGLSAQRYARRLAPSLRSVDEAARDVDPAAWAAESLALRGAVYALRESPPPIVLDAEYVAAAQRVTAERLARAGERLAATLNQTFCR
ncbi:MAG TPA: S1/P1 nuclease [Gammaproteobacteria bacterium]|nr:S1/P1 nuclease [Gammaproteobacteria bacterium]